MQLFACPLPKRQGDEAYRAMLRGFLQQLGYHPGAFLAQLLRSRYDPLSPGTTTPDHLVEAAISLDAMDERAQEVVEALVEGIGMVRAELGALVTEGRENDVDGLVGLLVSHMLELWSVQRAGAGAAEACLRKCL